MEKEIFVTKAYLPPRAEFDEYLDRIWDSAWLTNMGKLHEQLKEKLAAYLGVGGIELFVNGHLALEMCLQAFDFPKGGEVITSPFSFASTTHAIVRQGLRPVFADVRPTDCTLDPDKLEALITPRTVAILPVHVYGNVCDVDAIQKIADRHGLKVIYDAAHAFGEVVYGKQSGTEGATSNETGNAGENTNETGNAGENTNETGNAGENINGTCNAGAAVICRGIGTFGDASMFSFHATKVYNTIEGGAVTWNVNACVDASDKNDVDLCDDALIKANPNVNMNAKMNVLDAVSLKTDCSLNQTVSQQSSSADGSSNQSASQQSLKTDGSLNQSVSQQSSSTDGSGVSLNISDKSDFAKKLYQLKNFGITSQEQVGFVGGNAKMNEFQAAMGLCNLNHIEELIAARCKIYERYMEGLAGTGVRCLLGDKNITYKVKRNFAYFPVLFESEKRRNEIFEKLAAKGIHARKYFYPCINDYDCYKDEYDSADTPVAKDLAARVLTLPIYHDLENEIVDEICRIIKE